MATATRNIRTVKIISDRRFFPRMAPSSMATLACSLFQQQNEVVKTYSTAQQIKTNWPLCILGFCIALKWKICRETCPWGHNKFTADGLLVFLGKNTVTIHLGSPFTKKRKKTQGVSFQGRDCGKKQRSSFGVLFWSQQTYRETEVLSASP